MTVKKGVRTLIQLIHLLNSHIMGNSQEDCSAYGRELTLNEIKDGVPIPHIFESVKVYSNSEIINVPFFIPVLLKHQH